MFYDVTLTADDNGTWLVDVPALPHVHTFGDTKEEALARAHDAILTGLEMLVDAKQPIPAFRVKVNGKTPHWKAPALVAAKVALHNAMLDQKVGKYALGKKLDWHLPQVDRLVDFRHASKLDQVEQALEAIGLRLVVSVEPIGALRDAPPAAVDLMEALRRSYDQVGVGRKSRAPGEQTAPSQGSRPNRRKAS